LLDVAATKTPTTITLHEVDQFALELEDPIERFRVFGNDTDPIFAAAGIRKVGDLLDADAEHLSRELDRPGISTSVVELWQIHVALLVYVPNLNLNDVQLLTGAGITNLAELADADAAALLQAIRDFLDSPRGARHRSLRTDLDRDRVENWVADAGRERARWRNTPYATRGSHTHRPTRKAGRPGSNGNGKPQHRSTAKKRRRPLKFRLSRTSPVVDAPSVGPKMARRMAKIGISTVADLLAADAARTAEALDMKHISAKTIVAWQHQSQLMCRVPELLARDTQVLVGCGFTTPEDIASADTADLLEFAKSFVSTPEGTRVLRGGDPPDLARVQKWVFWAGHRRAMEAA
jgi:predicted flap endonuclease-1-like 5' DNA nuclease